MSENQFRNNWRTYNREADRLAESTGSAAAVRDYDAYLIAELLTITDPETTAGCITAAKRWATRDHNSAVLRGER